MYDAVRHIGILSRQLSVAKHFLIIETGGIRGGGQIVLCKQTPMPGLHPTSKTHNFVDGEGKLKGAG